jgi:hypothetical protein
VSRRDALIVEILGNLPERRPRFRSRAILFTIALGIDDGRPSMTPSRFFTARASLVLCPMSRRSNWANVAMTLAIISPDGVVVSTPSRG